MKTKTSVLLLSLCLFLSMCSRLKKDEYRITGEIKGLPDSTMLYLESNEIRNMDSTLAIHGKFTFRGTVKEPLICGIRNKPPRLSMPQVVVFWLEAGNIKIKAVAGKTRFAKVSGSRMNEEMGIYATYTEKVTKKIDSLNKILERLPSGDPLYQKLALEHNKLVKEDGLKMALQFFSEHPDFISCGFGLSIEMRRIPKEETKKLFDKFTPEVKSSKFGKEIQEYLAIGKNPKVGDMAVDFRVETPTGDKISLSDFKGKYVLLEFWGSGCAPCRAESPNLLKNYKAYKDKGFEIFSVSMDKSKNAMQKAASEDGMIWKTGADWMGFDGNPALIYSVSSIPANYLISPKGDIIAQNLRGDDLEHKLKEIFVK